MTKDGIIKLLKVKTTNYQQLIINIMKTFDHNIQKLSRIRQRLIKINYDRINFKNYEDIMLSGTMRFAN